MITPKQIFGGSWRYVSGTTVKVNPDLARLYTLYPTADHDLILPAPDELPHWRPGEAFFTLINFGLFDVTVKDHEGNVLAVLDHFGDEVLELDLVELSATSIEWAFTTRAL